MPWRGKWETELGGVLVTHAIHPHDMLQLPDGAGADGLRPRRDAGQRHRGRGLRLRQPADGKRRARSRFAARSARRTRSAASGCLRERHLRKRPRALFARQGSLEDPRRQRRRSRRDRRPARRLDSRSPRASRRRWRTSTTPSDGRARCR